MIWNILEVNFLKISALLIIDCIKLIWNILSKTIWIVTFKQFIYSFQLSLQAAQLHIFLGHSDDRCLSFAHVSLNAL